jgi:hypothetical protein
MESIAPMWSLKRPNACKSQERRAGSARSAGSARHDYIFFILQKRYIHIYNLYLILKISDLDVLLVRPLHLVSLALLLLGHGFEPHLLHCFFNILCRFNQ